MLCRRAGHPGQLALPSTRLSAALHAQRGNAFGSASSVRSCPRWGERIVAWLLCRRRRAAPLLKVKQLPAVLRGHGTSGSAQMANRWRAPLPAAAMPARAGVCPAPAGFAKPTRARTVRTRNFDRQRALLWPTKGRLVTISCCTARRAAMHLNRRAPRPLLRGSN